MPLTDGKLILGLLDLKLSKFKANTALEINKIIKETRKR